jgi:hypothetical protein
MICATSFADSVRRLLDQVSRSSRRHRAFAGRKSSQLTLNHKLFLCRGAAPVVIPHRADGEGPHAEIARHLKRGKRSTTQLRGKFFGSSEIDLSL